MLASPTVTVLKPSNGWVPINFRSLWKHRELLYFLIWRDIKVRYKQTALGAAWAVMQPLLTMVVFTIFFGRLASVPSDGIPYPIFSLTALVPWALFANGLAQAANSLVGSQELIKKVYFPRLIIPTASVLAGVVDFLIAFCLLLVMMLVAGIVPGSSVVWLIPLVLLALITSLGVGLWFAALNVRYRDIRYITPFVVQLWLLATPIAYPSSLLAPPWRTLYGLNPMAGVVEGFRWSLLGVHNAPGSMLIVSSAVALLMLVSGAFYFRRMERTFADVI